ncbi:ABC transporter ATP-binding protein [Thermanaeromonas sp. C210]|uniref:ABC transporter ATP-binding protein n=1 Tax=Thermanaeromonas sp. C210 TaxID=2731925 RepID=UPI00155BABDC|nr:ABC transporter ATP-binding protein [Thermanaeromonas sp. C210]GFN22300.1 ABC transporter ATP-binding protein [Thermanaeromonas sp. C210]
MGDGYLLEVRGIVKKFPGVVANDHVSFGVYPGEIHALLGENGAGKSTLMKILYGLYRPDAGSIVYKGKEISIPSPQEAIRLGIGMIHQHFMLVESFTVLENIVLGMPPLTKGFLNRQMLAQQVHEKFRDYLKGINLGAEVESLSVGTRQKVEILKALYRGAELLIMDEPTSVLTPQETEDLFVMLRELKKQGCTIIFISHKLDEVLRISDRITVLRDGRVVGTVNRHEVTAEDLSRMMVGRDVSLWLQKRPCRLGKVCLRLRDVSLLDTKGKALLDRVYLELREGEILGVAGVDGNGQTELAEVIAGIRPVTRGSIELLGREVSGLSTRQRLEMGLSYVPADRQHQGLVMEFTVAENFVLETYYSPPFTRRWSLQWREIFEFARRLVREYDVRTPGPQTRVKHISGGNQQKIVMGRELSRSPRVMVVARPTWGLDVGAREYIHRRLLDQRDRGVAILLISTDLEEVRSLSDRLVVIYEGRIMGEVDPGTTKVETIGMLMAGVKQEAS